MVCTITILLSNAMQVCGTDSILEITQFYYNLFLPYALTVGNIEWYDPSEKILIAFLGRMVGAFFFIALLTSLMLSAIVKYLQVTVILYQVSLEKHFSYIDNNRM